MLHPIEPRPVWRPRGVLLVIGLGMWAMIGAIVLSLVGCGGRGGVTPKLLLAETRAVVVQTADSLEISLYFTVQGNLASIDSIGGSLEQPTGTIVRKLAIPAAQRNVVTFKRARPLTAISGRVCAGPLYMKGGTQLAGSCLTWGYVPPSITTDSIRIAMDVRVFDDSGLIAHHRTFPDRTVRVSGNDIISVETGKSAQWCVFVRFGRGRFIAKPNDEVTRCKQDFSGAYLAVRT